MDIKQARKLLGERFADAPDDEIQQLIIDTIRAANLSLDHCFQKISQDNIPPTSKTKD